MSSAGYALENLGNLLMKYSMDKQQDKRDTKRRQMEEELRRKYEESIIDSSQTRIENGQEVRYNKFGVEVNRRSLAPEEIEARQAELEERRAKTARATAEAESAKVEAEYKRPILDSTLESQAASRRASEASAASSYASTDIARERLALENQRYEDGLTKAQQDKINQAEEMLYAIGNGPDAAASEKAQLLEAKLAAAKAAGDSAEVNRILNQVKGELILPFTREMKRAESGGLDAGMPPQINLGR